MIFQQADLKFERQKQVMHDCKWTWSCCPFEIVLKNCVRTPLFLTSLSHKFNHKLQFDVTYAMTEEKISYNNMLLGVFYRQVTHWFSFLFIAVNLIDGWFLFNYLLEITYLDWLVILGHVGIIWFLGFAVLLWESPGCHRSLNQQMSLCNFNFAIIKRILRELFSRRLSKGNRQLSAWKGSSLLLKLIAKFILIAWPVSICSHHN